MTIAGYWTGNTIGDVVAVLAVLVGSVLSITLLARFRPRFGPRIIPSWADDEQRRLILRFEIENVSPVAAFSPRAYFQVEPKTLPEGGELDEWMTFSPDKETRTFATTDRIYPGEVAAVERIRDVPDEDLVLHIGLRLELGFWANLLSLGRHRQTTTCFVAKQAIRRAT